jgi:hypothetical protein
MLTGMRLQALLGYAAFVNGGSGSRDCKFGEDLATFQLSFRMHRLSAHNEDYAEVLAKAGASHWSCIVSIYLQ